MENKDPYYVSVFRSDENCPMLVVRVQHHEISERNDLLLVLDFDDNSNTQSLVHASDWDYFNITSLNDMRTAVMPVYRSDKPTTQTW